MAATQRGFRPRPLDQHKHLTIVTDASQLETSEGVVQREITNNHESLDKNNEQAKMVKAKGGHEIPIPEVNDIPDHITEYLPNFRPPGTYIRGRGPNWERALDDRYVEYDMDIDDQRWLNALNGDQQRLSEAHFELLMDTLEKANAAATDRILTSQGASQAEKQTPTAVAAIEHFWKQEAMEVMHAAVPVREHVRSAVYEHWRQKRLALNRPLLRSLQAPTASGDSNPYNVFRPRDKAHRPQTRRRRENNGDSLEKLHQIHLNLTAARDMLKTICKRELRKTQIAVLEIDSQQYQIRRTHEPRSQWDQLDAEFLAAVKSKMPHRKPLGWDSPPSDASSHKKRKRDKPLTTDALGPPPVPVVVPPLFEVPIDLDKLSLHCNGPEEIWKPKEPMGPQFRSRMGRGGRLVFDRSHWLTAGPVTELYDTGAIPLWQQANLYAFVSPEARGRGGGGAAGAVRG